MYNYCFFIGRLVRDVRVNTTETGRKVSTITLAVNRPFKNSQTNTIESDFIAISIWEPLIDNVASYMHKGDVIGVKGRIQPRKEEINGQAYYTQEIIADNIHFISSNPTIED